MRKAATATRGQNAECRNSMEQTCVCKIFLMPRFPVAKTKGIVSHKLVQILTNRCFFKINCFIYICFCTEVPSLIAHATLNVFAFARKPQQCEASTNTGTFFAKRSEPTSNFALAPLYGAENPAVDNEPARIETAKPFFQAQLMTSKCSRERPHPPANLGAARQQGRAPTGQHK